MILLRVVLPSFERSEYVIGKSFHHFQHTEREAPRSDSFSPRMRFFADREPQHVLGAAHEQLARGHARFAVLVQVGDVVAGDAGDSRSVLSSD
jgi:hypothetical protein